MTEEKDITPCDSCGDEATYFDDDAPLCEYCAWEKNELDEYVELRRRRGAIGRREDILYGPIPR